jgi:chromate transporter
VLPDSQAFNRVNPLFGLMIMVHNSADVFFAFLKLGFTAFGGPAAHIGYFHKEFVERRCWLTEQQFAQLLALCQLLPGPASSQLGFCLGLMRAGWLGALTAFLAFTAPSAFLLVGFSAVLPWLSGGVGQALLHGLKIIAFVIVSDAVISMAKKLCPDMKRASIAIVVAVLMLAGSSWGGVFATSLFLIVIAAMAGYFLCSSGGGLVAQSIQVGYGKT